MTLDEAIVHAEEVGNNMSCDLDTKDCGAEHLQLAEWLKELKDLKSRYLYLAADFDNYKKRTLKEEHAAYDRGQEQILRDILNVVDDLERVVEILDKRPSEEKMFEVYEQNPIHSGIQLTYENLLKMLKAYNCEKIDVREDDDFDVNTMEAISTTECTEGASPDRVAKIYQSGWNIDGKLLRPAKVVVYK